MRRSDTADRRSIPRDGRRRHARPFTGNVWALARDNSIAQPFRKGPRSLIPTVTLGLVRGPDVCRLEPIMA